jgi:hypothetical protein
MPTLANARKSQLKIHSPVHPLFDDEGAKRDLIFAKIPLNPPFDQRGRLKL